MVKRISLSTIRAKATALTATCLIIALSPNAHASPFINATPHPELTALRPVISAVPEASSTVVSPASSALPELVLSFVPPPAPVAPAPGPRVYADIWERMRAGFAIDDLRIKEVAEAQDWYAKRPELVTNILQRSRYYLYYIVDEIEKRGMPTELALLPFVESGFNPRALSSAQAMGLWQFIPETGTKYRLDQNNVYDARRDIIASTTAALDYLQFLHGLFGDWQLALAAYNWGERAVGQAVERNRARGLPTDFASLTLPAETRNYVPKLLAVKRLVLSPSSFGVALPRVDNDPYFVAVAMPPGVDLKEAARLADMEHAEFDTLNAAYVLPHQHPTPMRAVIRVDKISGFFERVREFIQRAEARRANQAASVAKRGKPAAAACCQRR
jgi:membrane-bound lytic murein transglycosylase D